MSNEDLVRFLGNARADLWRALEDMDDGRDAQGLSLIGEVMARLSEVRRLVEPSEDS